MDATMWCSFYVFRYFAIVLVFWCQISSTQMAKACVNPPCVYVSSAATDPLLNRPFFPECSWSFTTLLIFVRWWNNALPSTGTCNLLWWTGIGTTICKRCKVDGFLFSLFWWCTCVHDKLFVKGHCTLMCHEFIPYQFNIQLMNQLFFTSCSRW